MNVLNDKLNGSVVTLGKFDCLHIGHIHLINIAKKEAEKRSILLTVYTFSDILPEKLISDEEKVRLLYKLGADYVYVKKFDEELKNMSPEMFFCREIIDKLNAKFIVAGTDWRFGKNREGNTDTLKQLCQKYNIDCKIEDKIMIDGVTASSTHLRNLIKSGDVSTAIKFLNRPYCVSGIVEEGNHIGRKIGFPTANTKLKEDRVYPANGVYITKTTVDDKTYPSVTNIGTNPTVGNVEKRMESHIYGFSSDIYSKSITVEFFEKIRDEITFKNIDELKKRLTKDVEIMSNFFEKLQKNEK